MLAAASDEGRWTVEDGIFFGDPTRRTVLSGSVDRNDSCTYIAVKENTITAMCFHRKLDAQALR
jgi:hypothetical protein